MIDFWWVYDFFSFYMSKDVFDFFYSNNKMLTDFHVYIWYL